jgi:site-specific DNA-methyltransferase (adenine-specific)
MRVAYLDRSRFHQALRETGEGALDFVVIVTAALDPSDLDGLKAVLDECTRALKYGGLLFVQGRPDYLPELGVYLDQRLHFKYWIAVESALRRGSGLPSVHAAVLLFTKGDGRFSVKRTRFPHQYCAHCGRTLKDWGGKAHLMHPDGYVISDVWKDLPPADNYTRLSAPVLEAILRMVDTQGTTGNGKEDLFHFTHTPVPAGETQGVVGPVPLGSEREMVVAEPSVQYVLPGFSRPETTCPPVVTEIGAGEFDVIHRGDAVEVLKQYPDHSIDLVFADPPYNLDKAYHIYDDERAGAEYVAWCNAWLAEYARVLKPTGSLYVLNLPRWTMYHAAFLNRKLYFQNWIVWDALSEPRGKLMPAHYGLLFYTKHPTDFTFNYDAVGTLDARYYCLRASCIRRRKAAGVDDQTPLTDLWWDVHRIKHKRDRDYHPCQLPEPLMERIVRLSTNEGDVVLDALCGTGTTLVVAARLGRRYVGIDIDARYVQITRDKIAEVQRQGYVVRESVQRPQRAYTKKELQLELRELAARLGRLPTPEDVRRMSQYDLDVFTETFPTWGKALKAAKLEVQS